MNAHVLGVREHAALLLFAGDAESVRISAESLQNAVGILEANIRAKEINAASILVARRGKIVLHRGFGRVHKGAGASTVQPDSAYGPDTRLQAYRR